MPVRIWTVLFMALIVLAACRPARADQDAATTLNPAFQNAIANFADAASDVEPTAALEQLMNLDSPPYHRLVQQVVLHSSRATDVKSAMASGVILRQLNVSNRNLVEAVMPLLGAAEPGAVRAAQGALESVEDRSASRRPDFSTYREILEERIRGNEKLPPWFVQYIYQAHPGEALLAMMRAHQLRQPADLKAILWAEHVVSDTLWKQQYGFLAPTAVEPEAADQLARLANHPQWWARLYAAEVMRQLKPFRQPALLQKLQDDAHELVRATAMLASQDQ